MGGQGKVKKEALVAKGLYRSREKDNGFRHLHKGSHEVVLGGTVRELSLVTTPAYNQARFEPIQVVAQ
jgi:hypothetical protein